jgi:predicted tellurium resistance membrane protein TerC
MDIDPFEERILRRVPLEILAAGAAVGLVALPFFGGTTAIFVLAGGALASLGFLWMKVSLTRFLQRERRAALRSGVLIYLVRFVLILAVFSFIMFFFPRKIIAFVAGFSVLVPVFLIEGVFALLRMKTWKS